MVITTRNIDQDQVQVTVEDWEQVWIRTRWPGSSSPSTPQNPAVWAWDSRFAVPSFKTMAAGCGLRLIMGRAQASTLRFRSTMKKGRIWEPRQASDLGFRQLLDHAPSGMLGRPSQ